jgi:hypothetical protein
MAETIQIHPVTDVAFRRYGRVVEGFEVSELLAALRKTPLPQDGTVYVPSDASLENTPAFAALRDAEFGGLPIEIGYCNGVNHKLNALEYHRSSEVNLAVDDMILLLGALQDVDPADYTYDTSRVEAFLVPAGTMVEMYATTLHFAPCSVNGKGFRNAVILPRGTNEPLKIAPAKTGEQRLLFAANKWMIAHPGSGLQKDGAFVGLTGENITLE